MLANFLNKSKPINFIGLLVFFVLFSVASIYRDFSRDFFSINILSNTIFVILIFSLLFFIYSFIISKNNLTFDNYYGFYFFAILCANYANDILTNKTLFLIVVYLLFLRKIYSLQSSKSIIKKLFDSGFWIGILCLFDPNYSVLLMLIYFGAYWYQKITIHTLLTPVFGFLTPIFSYFSYLFWIDEEAVFYEIFTPKNTYDFSFFSDDNDRIFMIILLIFTLFAAISKSLKVMSINNTFKKSWNLILINLLVAFGLLLVQDDLKNTEIIFLCFPISLILANGLELIKKRIYIDIALYLFLIGCLFYSFYL